MYDRYQRGEASGFEKGHAEGRAEERLAIAKSLLAEGVSIALVMQSTGLSKDILKQLTSR